MWFASETARVGQHESNLLLSEEGQETRAIHVRESDHSIELHILAAGDRVFGVVDGVSLWGKLGFQMKLTWSLRSVVSGPAYHHTQYHNAGTASTEQICATVQFSL